MAGLTIYLVSHHHTGDLRPVLSQLCVPAGQVLIGDLPLHIKHLTKTSTVNDTGYDISMSLEVMLLS